MYKRQLQHRAEAAGARFIAIREPRKLSGIVTANDELLVLAPGVLPDEDAVMRHLAKPCVLVFPADPAVQRGYERIDLHFAWAGALVVRGTAVEQLAQLPGDVDTPSALLRIALPRLLAIQSMGDLYEFAPELGLPTRDELLGYVE